METTIENKSLSTLICEANMSVRLYNGLRNYFSYELGVSLVDFRNCQIIELSKISLSKFSTIRNAGKKTIKELEDFCLANEITLQP